MVARPFVKWAGGKSALLGEIRARCPELASVERYIEPFVGAGAMFFSLRTRAPSLPCLISDSNAELVLAYIAIRDELPGVVSELERHQAEHSEAHFYAVRAAEPEDAAGRAARFIYLNKTCFNGLYRVNRRGEFNVPMGRYAEPRILDRDNLRAAAAALDGVDIRVRDFGEPLGSCRAGDLVYLDPPYHPLSRTSSFTSYTRDRFGKEEQVRLAEHFQTAARRGAFVILSNSSDPFVRELYQALDPKPRIEEVAVPRAINSKGGKRGPVRELLVYYDASVRW